MPSWSGSALKKRGIPFVVAGNSNCRQSVILLFCFVGSFAIRASYFDVWVMLAMGLLGLFLEAKAVPLGPVVLGIILGGRLEETFVQSLAKSTTLLDFVSRPAAALLAFACLVLWASPWLFRKADQEPQD